MYIYQSTLEYYVYAYLRRDGSPYYIGKGKDNRAWVKHRTVSTPKEKHRIVILESGLTNIGACALERRYIRWYGRKDFGTGNLHNRTDGGETTLGWVPKESTRKIMRENNTGTKNPFYGKKHTEDHKEKMRKLFADGIIGTKGKKLSEETKAKMRVNNAGSGNPMYGVRKYGKDNPFFGKKHSEETKEKIRQTRLRNKQRNSNDA